MKKNTLLLAYAEAFISVIPYVVLTAIAIILSDILSFLEIDSQFINKETLKFSVSALSNFFPFVLIIAIAFQLAKRYAMSQSVVMFQSLAIFICAEALKGLNQEYEIIFSPPHIHVLIIPFFVVKALGYLTAARNRYHTIGSELNASINHIYSGVLSFIIIVSALIFVEQFFSNTFDINIYNSSLPSGYALYIRTLSNHILWFFGLHGSNVFDSIYSTSFLKKDIFPSMTYKQFYDLFVIYGGSGAGLSLIIAILISGKDVHSNKIAKLSLPFTIFNISEILVYGLPIIFNRRLLVPFIIVPIVNITVSYLVISHFPIEVISDKVSWITPIFINSYIVTDGNIIALILQLFLLMLGAIIYIPFVRKYTIEQSSQYQNQTLCEKLNVQQLLKSEQEIEANKARQAIILSNSGVAKTISLLDEKNLFVYYQPKVDIKKGSCHQFEALLRIKMPDGQIRGPFFLPHIETAGLAPIIDLWVCQQVNEHLREWEAEGGVPEISINLHPDTLAHTDTILQIIEILDENNIDFEIIERGLLDNKKTICNIELLKEYGFSISIDDFGTGFSSLENLCHFSVDTLKIDKSITDLIHTNQGYIICQNIVALANNMNFSCIIEGVETEEQIQIISKLDISYVQGYYFSPAISKLKAQKYKPKIITNVSNRPQARQFSK